MRKILENKKSLINFHSFEANVAIRRTPLELRAMSRSGDRFEQLSTIPTYPSYVNDICKYYSHIFLILQNSSFTSEKPLFNGKMLFTNRIYDMFSIEYI